jgi:hypothetical protein
MDGSNYSEGWESEHVSFPVKGGDFTGSLVFFSGELTSDKTYPFLEIAVVTESENSILITEGFPSHPIFSPSKFLVDADTSDDTIALDSVAKEYSGGVVSANTVVLPLEKQDLPPKLLPLKKARLASKSQNKEGRTKFVRCAWDRAVSERLAFGEDVEMDRVLEFLEKVVVGKVRGKKMGLAYLKGWVTKN